MKEVQFIRATWLELAAANYPAKVLVYSYTVQVPDFPDTDNGRVSLLYRRPPETDRVILQRSA